MVWAWMLWETIRKGGGCCHARRMDAQRKTPCVVAAVILRLRKVRKCCSCHTGQSLWAERIFCTLTARRSLESGQDICVNIIGGSPQSPTTCFRRMLPCVRGTFAGLAEPSTVFRFGGLANSLGFDELRLTSCGFDKLRLSLGGVLTDRCRHTILLHITRWIGTLGSKLGSPHLLKINGSSP